MADILCDLEIVLYTGKATDIMDFIEQHEAQDFSNTGYGLQQVEGVGIVLLSRFEDIEFEVLEQLILVGDQSQIDFDGLLHGGIVKAFGHPVSVGLVGDLFADLG